MQLQIRAFQTNGCSGAPLPLPWLLPRRAVARRPPPRCRCAAAGGATAEQAAPFEQQFGALVELLSAGPPPPVKAALTPLGRGLVACRDLAAEERILSVDSFNALVVADEPQRHGNAFSAAALSDWEALHGELPPALRSYLLSGRGDWFRRLVAWLLWLARHGGGVWPLYVSLLPAEGDMGSLMNFTPEEREHLQWPQLAALADKERQGIRGLHDQLFSSATGELASLDLAPTFEHTLWAACMVNSRCFSDAAGREAVTLMVPCCDLANHGTEPNAAFRLDPPSQLFSLTATQAVPAGGEILISYLGDQPKKSNFDLMKDYGFVLPGNPNDAVDFEPVAGGGAATLLRPAALLAAAADLPPPGSSSERAAPEAASAEAAHRRRQQAAMRSLTPFMALGSGVLAAEPQEERQLALQLVQQCRQQLDRCATCLEEDQELLSSEAALQLPPRVQAAVAARLEHKLLVAAAGDMLRRYAASTG